MTTFWAFALLPVAIYCIWQTARDIRRGNYLMAGAGCICAALLIFMPIPTHAVKLDLLMPVAR